MTYSQILTVDKHKAAKIQEMLDMETVDFDSLDIDEDAMLESFTAKFEDGHFVDIIVCSGQNNCWVDSVFYSPSGEEITNEPSDSLLGESEFSYKGNNYCVNLVEC